MKTAQVFKEGEATPVLQSVQIADNLWTRFWGLMGRRDLADYDGLLITASSSVHTMFMRFPIDVVYLGAEGRVIKISTVKPYRASVGRGGKQVLELAAGLAGDRGISVGDTLHVVVSEG